ncbi:caspase family protein [Acidovorax sp. NCPPB 3859]|nr:MULTISPECIES: caspase family protein [unclassified Acidovorax]MDA8462517.1 caspase family protein [Acidovorax sp. GBBC 3333]MDA8472586.1 caspase family protein [Acidovorax sp. GBBC 3299]WCM77617.1 caspase family protein [Acidovorax sp. GBBC 712]WCM82508.1 caspase family protein [Acidovorax sp. NCPPB 3859]
MCRPSLAATANPDDTVVIFFSGHGGRKIDAPEYAGYLFPADYVPGDPDGTGLLAEDLTELLNAIPAARIVLLMDACHSEAAVHVKAEGESKGMLPGLRNPALEKLSSGNGRVVIASCREDEVSMTSSWRGHSLFTHFLLEGLRGQALGADDGTVRVLDLFTYLSEQVPANPVSNMVQHPVLRARTESNFPLALRKGGWFKGEDAAPVQATVTALVAPAVEPLTSNSSVIDWRKVAPVMAQLYPSGPGHNEIWSRAGGEPSALTPAGSGQAAWHTALRMIHNGGGGTTMRALLETALDEFPGNDQLRAMARRP